MRKTKYETNKSYYDKIVDFLIKDKIPVEYMVKPNGYKGKSNMHKGTITKRIQSSIIINTYLMDLSICFI